MITWRMCSGFNIFSCKTILDFLKTIEQAFETIFYQKDLSIQVLYKKGSRKDPWDTPYLINPQSEYIPLSTTLCFLFLGN